MVEIEVTGKSTNTTTTVDVKADHFHNILFGGDQLTVARACGAQHARENRWGWSPRWVSSGL